MNCEFPECRREATKRLTAVDYVDGDFVIKCCDTHVIQYKKQFNVWKEKTIK